MTPMFQKKRIYFIKKIHDFIMCVDRELFQTMLYNYLDNAVSVSKEEDIVEINAYQTDMENIIEISDQSGTKDGIKTCFSKQDLLCGNGYRSGDCSGTIP